MKGRVLMVQGTASHVGKSFLVAALCRIFKQDGFRVAPFKGQNMSLNSYVTADGLEIARAQAVQAQACGIEPLVEMNPILLKPETDSCCQVIVMGRPLLSTTAKDYYKLKPFLWSVITKSLDYLRDSFEIVVIEGAGSPAEVNLEDMVNMRVARYCSSPVLLVGDIDRGGVFASLLGTIWLLKPEERALIKGLVINKFRGDLTLLGPGLRFLEEKSGIPVAGVIPYLSDIHIAQEDSLALEQPFQRRGFIDIAVLKFPHISNFDDFDPLRWMGGVSLRYVSSPQELGTPDLVILPGSKTTIADLDWLRLRGLEEKILELYHQGVFILGICGGYQMLGKHVLDPEGVESSFSERQGLGLLPASTVFCRSKETHRVRGRVRGDRGLLKLAYGVSFEGYEIHMGRTDNALDEAPFYIEERSGKPCQVFEGYLDAHGQVLGTYIHGLFHNRELCLAILRYVAQRKGVSYDFATAYLPDKEYDRLAELVRGSLDMGLIYWSLGLR